MKKTYIIIILLAAFCYQAKAVGAYPHPIQITQPDGSTITIQLHGDEFLHWTTYGGRLVQQAPDGFFYYASFNIAGNIVRSQSKVGNGMLMTSSFSTVTPPPAAVQKALEMRKQAFDNKKLNIAPHGRAASMSSARESISLGSKHFLILLVQFSDLHFTVDAPQSSFNNLLNQNGYSVNGGTGSVKDYYEENSTNAFQPIFDVVGLITLDHGYAYYGEESGGSHDIRPREMVSEACTKADALVDFSQYDLDRDGYVENVFLFFAGHNQAEGGGANTIWPHAWNVYPALTLDGVTISSYGCTSEYGGSSGTRMCGIGTFCHEFGHTIGLPDFYDIDYEDNGYADALGEYSLMSSGNYNNGGKTPPYLTSMERYILGYMELPTVLDTPGSKTLLSVNNNVAYSIPTSNEGEYFQFEGRVQSGWDTYISKPGLVIYHVDKSQNMVAGMTAAQRWNYEDINSVAAHQCFDMVESVYPESSATYLDRVFPGSTNNTFFTASSSPAFVAWSGIETGYGLTNIAATSTGASFYLSIVSNVRGVVTNTSSLPLAGAKVTITKDSDPTNPIMLTTNSSGVFSLEGMPIGEECQISVSMDRYAPYLSTFTTITGTTGLTVTLKTLNENLAQEVVKHNGNPMYLWGNGAGNNVYAAFSLSPTEISARSLAGSTIKTISFYPYCSSATKVEVIVHFGNREVLREEVSSVEYYDDNTVDISDFGLQVPSDEMVYIGYGIVAPNGRNSIVSDGGPLYTDGGSFYISSTGTPGNWDNNNLSNPYNLYASATFENEVGVFSAYGYNTIASNSASYSIGSTLVLSISVGGETPSSIAWTYDGLPKANGSFVRLALGDHALKAVLTYADGSKETLEKTIVVR